MPAQDLPRIDINSAGVAELTQLPGIAKNTAYNIVNHRQRHGLFTAWEELVEVKDFPTARLSQIKLRAELKLPEEARSARAVTRAHLERLRKKPAGYTKASRSSRRPGKMHDPSVHRPH
jgi:helix-hairpin-helix protein